jgi:putative isomerase
VRTQDSRRKEQEPRVPHVIADFVPDERGVAEGAVEEFLSVSRGPDLSARFTDCVAAVESEWEAWKRTTPSLPKRYARSAELAMYVNWASVVAPLGCFRRPTMLMSKNWMTQCWSWDHCFNAMALSYRSPDLAWDQWMTLFDHQDGNGALPDSVSATQTTWNFCKPPVHGWALSKMMKKRGLLTDARAREAYRVLSRWTDWWMARDYDGDGLPEYRHGNDSGWDNSTVFDGGFPVAAPDLAAYLVVQMDALSALADRLGRNRAAAQWKGRANALRDRMIEVLWDGGQFVSRRAFTGEVFPEGDSLINYLPIVMGRRLPKTIRDQVAAGLAPGGRFVRDFGPATESPDSPLYVPDGYWRGPIWGPEAVIVVDGLAQGGYKKQAAEIARRYSEMCRRSGFAENFNALTGEPLRDKAYTWGSSAFLTLAHEFLRR